MKASCRCFILSWNSDLSSSSVFIRKRINKMWQEIREEPVRALTCTELGQHLGPTRTSHSDKYFTWKKSGLPEDNTVMSSYAEAKSRAHFNLVSCALIAELCRLTCILLVSFTSLQRNNLLHITTCQHLFQTRSEGSLEKQKHCIWIHGNKDNFPLCSLCQLCFVAKAFSHNYECMFF